VENFLFYDNTLRRKTTPEFEVVSLCHDIYISALLTLNLPTTTTVAQPFNIIKWQLKFNPVA